MNKLQKSLLKLAKTELQKVYRIRIDYGMANDESEEKVSNLAYSLARKNDLLYINETNGGPCWNAYFIIESEKEHLTRNAAVRLINYIKRFKGHEFY